MRLLGSAAWAERRREGLDAATSAGLRRLLRPHPRRGWALRPGVEVEGAALDPTLPGGWSLRVSADGWRGRPRAERPEGEVRIVAIGDEATLGWGLAEDQAWPARLEAALDEAAQVINLGSPGQTLWQAEAWLDELGDGFVYDHLVVGLGAAEGRLTIGEDPAVLGGSPGPWATPALLGRLLAGPSARLGLQAHRLGWSRPRLSPAALVAALERLGARGVPLLVVDLCLGPAHRAAVRDYLRRRDQEWIDAAALHGDTLDGCVPGPQGQERVAGEIARRLLREG